MTPAIFGVAGTTLTANERAFFADADPAGYILFARNCETRDQMRSLTDALRTIKGRDRLLVSIDQEGGRVQRMAAPEWPPYPAGQAFDTLYRTAPASAIQAARLNAELLARDLAEVGITVNFHAPCDLRLPETVDAIGDRAMGADPMQVAALARAVLDGHARAGVAGCIKHMPGHGRATVDSHHTMPEVTATEAELEADIAPFATLSDTKIGMSAHIRYPVWDADNPATLSPFIIEHIIRKRIGFEGLLLTDDIDMQALDGSIPERSARAIAAGCDIVLNCWAKVPDMEGMVAALPPIAQRAAERLDAALAGTGVTETPPENRAASDELRAQRDALLAL